MKLARPLIVALLAFAVVVSAIAVAATNGTAAAGTGIVQLPPEVLLDRHLLRAERLLAAGDPAGAIEAMDEILALQEEHDLELPDDFDFQYAQVAYASGRTETAISSLNEYLVAAGREGEFYREALELLDSAEVRLEGEEAERRRARRRVEAQRRRADRWPPGHVFRDCETCPEMVVLPGSTVALGRYEVTLGEYRAFAAATGGGAGGGGASLALASMKTANDAALRHDPLSKGAQSACHEQRTARNMGGCPREVHDHATMLL